MELSKELVFVEYENKYLVYNYFINKAVFINKNTHSNINKLKFGKIGIQEFLKFLNNDEIEILINNGVIYEDYDKYINMDYSLKLKNRNPKVELEIAYFHITQRCNLKYAYCYNNDKKFVLRGKQ